MSSRSNVFAMHRPCHVTVPRETERDRDRQTDRETEREIPGYE